MSSAPYASGAVLVTGANGFVGANVVARSSRTESSARVRAARLAATRDGLHVESRGDLRDEASVRRAVRGCRAGVPRRRRLPVLGARPAGALRQQRRGTASLMEACLAEGVERVVHTSTVGTSASPRSPRRATRGPRSRPASSRATTNARRSRPRRRRCRTSARGLPVVVVNPSAPVGPWDVKPTPTGKILVDFARGQNAGRGGHRAQHGAREGCRRGALARGGARPRRRAIHPRQPEHDADGDPRATSRRITGRRAPRSGSPTRSRGPPERSSTASANLVTHRPPSIPLEAVRMSRHRCSLTRGRRCASSACRRRPCGSPSRRRSA